MYNKYNSQKMQTDTRIEVIYHIIAMIAPDTQEGLSIMNYRVKRG